MADLAVVPSSLSCCSAGDTMAVLREGEDVRAQNSEMGWQQCRVMRRKGWELQRSGALTGR